MRYHIAQKQTKNELLAGDGKGKKIFSTISTVIDDLSREANSVFDYAKGKQAKTTEIEQNRIRNPFWNNSGLPGYMHYMTTTPQQQKQAGLDPNALKFMLLLGVVGFAIFKFLPTKNPTLQKIKPLKIK